MTRGVPDRLFVYGTLLPGRANAHELAGIEGTWAPATVTGTLLPDGWGAALGYPGVVLDAAGPVVPGAVLTSEDLAAHWDRLDAFEGDGYDRVTATALLEGGESVAAHLYVLRTFPDGLGAPA